MKPSLKCLEPSNGACLLLKYTSNYLFGYLVLYGVLRAYLFHLSIQVKQ